MKNSDDNGFVFKNLHSETLFQTFVKKGYYLLLLLLT